MKKNDNNKLSNQDPNKLPSRSSKHSPKRKWKPFLITITLLSTISIVILFQWSNVTPLWQSSFDSIQKLNKNKTTSDDHLDGLPENKKSDQEFKQTDKQENPNTEKTNGKIDKKESSMNFEVRRLTENINHEFKDSSYKDQVITFVNTDTVLKGVNVKEDFYYEVPIASVGSKNYLQLEISHSSLLDPKQSTLTVMIDDTPIKSVFLTSDNENQETIRIPLPKQFISPGFHKITVTSHNVITDNLCLDHQNPANWVKIHSSSFAYLDVKELWARKDPLKDFPYPFVQSGTPLEVHGYIVIPDQSSEQTLSAALTLSSYLSSVTTQQSGYPIMTESEWMEKQEFKHIIAIGSLDSWNGSMKTIIDENVIQTNSNELILENFILKQEEYKQLLLVSGPNDHVIHDRINILSNEYFEKQLTGHSLRVTKMPTTRVEVDRKKTLATIGFENILLNGNTNQSSSQFYTLPSFWEIQEGSYLDLMVKMSPSLQQIDSNGRKQKEEITNVDAFTVHLNNVPFGVSINQQEDTKDDSGFYHLQIPLSEQLLKDNRTLEVKFTSNLNNDMYGCNADLNNQWIFIDNDSTFQIHNNAVDGHNFKHWPYPYVGNPVTQNVAILIPNQLSQTLLSQLSSLYSSMLSQSINDQTKFTIIRGEPGQQERKVLKNAHVVIMGNLASYPFLQNELKHSRMKWNNQQIDISNYRILNETTDYVTWTEPSFWNNKRMMTVFVNMNQQDTYLHPDSLNYLLSQNEEVDLVVRNKSGDIFTENMQQKESKTTEQVEYAPLDKKTVILTIIGFSIILFIGIGIFIYSFRKSKRK